MLGKKPKLELNRKRVDIKKSQDPPKKYSHQRRSDSNDKGRLEELNSRICYRKPSFIGPGALCILTELPRGIYIRNSLIRFLKNTKKFFFDPFNTLSILWITPGYISKKDNVYKKLSKLHEKKNVLFDLFGIYIM